MEPKALDNYSYMFSKGTASYIRRKFLVFTGGEGIGYVSLKIWSTDVGCIHNFMGSFLDNDEPLALVIINPFCKGKNKHEHESLIPIYL